MGETQRAQGAKATGREDRRFGARGRAWSAGWGDALAVGWDTLVSINSGAGGALRAAVLPVPTRSGRRS